jgi:hypothetical protein
MSAPFRHVGATAKAAVLFTDNQADANKWKLRMLKAGIPGLDIPDDWDSLSEDEKQSRLDKIIDLAMEDV